MKWEMRSMPNRVAITGNCTANGKWEMRSVESRNEIDRVASVEIALQMGNEIDRVVVTGGMRSIESRSVEFALQTGNGK